MSPADDLLWAGRRGAHFPRCAGSASAAFAKLHFVEHLCLFGHPARERTLGRARGNRRPRVTCPLLRRTPGVSGSVRRSNDRCAIGLVRTSTERAIGRARDSEHGALRRAQTLAPDPALGDTRRTRTLEPSERGHAYHPGGDLHHGEVPSPVSTFVPSGSCPKVVACEGGLRQAPESSVGAEPASSHERSSGSSRAAAVS